ncbi:MAG TPA: NAD(P)-dependent oxidoreductase [Acetobacteraceae bacterium]|nr:NAD(P)-dependent oxidoreductase [Acetobacteraceae bacterium]
MRIGFIGLGTMGRHMAANLQRAGHQLAVHDVRREAAEAHVAAGARWAATPREAAAGAEVVFTSLPGPAEVEAVALGADGIIAGLGQGAAYFDLSTIAPSLVRRIHEAFAERGLAMLDSPVSGGPGGAESRKMAIWVGGSEEVFSRFKPVLDAMGDQARYIGPIGSASVAKLVHNCANYGVLAVLAEVFTMGVKAGVEPLALWQAVRQGVLGRRRTLDGLIDQFLPNRYDPAAFALRLAHKDVALATALGRELGVPMRLSNLTLEEMTEAMGRGWGGRDSRVSMVLQEERAGVTIEVAPEAIRKAVAEAGN